METPRGERFSDIRVEQAMPAGAEVLVTACSYCIANFEDSRLSLAAPGDGPVLQVQDITEIIEQVLG